LPDTISRELGPDAEAVRVLPLGSYVALDRLSGGRLSGREFQIEHLSQNRLGFFQLFGRERPQPPLNAMALDGADPGQIYHADLSQPRRFGKSNLGLASTNFLS
jgi:hypothetical protein